MKENLTPRNDKGEPHGLCVQYYSNCKVMYKCVYINGKRNGLEEYYWNDGKLTKSYYL